MEKTLRLFIKENINIATLFQTNNHIIMNAFADMISGPHPIDQLLSLEEDESFDSSFDILMSSIQYPSSTDYLTNKND